MTLLYAQTNDTQCPIPIQEFEIFEYILEKKRKKINGTCVSLLGGNGLFYDGFILLFMFLFFKILCFFLTTPDYPIRLSLLHIFTIKQETAVDNRKYTGTLWQNQQEQKIKIKRNTAEHIQLLGFFALIQRFLFFIYLLILFIFCTLVVCTRCWLASLPLSYKTIHSPEMDTTNGGKNIKKYKIYIHKYKRKKYLKKKRSSYDLSKKVFHHFYRTY